MSAGVAGWVEVARLDGLVAERPVAAAVEGVDLVVVREGDEVRVLSGRCPHRAARLAQHGAVRCGVLVCQRHGWDFRLDNGEPPGGRGEGLTRFEARIDPADGAVRVSLAAVRAHAALHPPVFHEDEDVA